MLRKVLPAALSVIAVVGIALLTDRAPAREQDCPAGTYYIYEDDTTIYCKRENEGIGDDRATRAAILKSAMAKLGYPYHQANTAKGESRCLDGDVSMCPTGEHSGGCYDCSALVYAVLQSVGQRVEPNAIHQYKYFEGISGGIKHANPIYGDVIFFVHGNPQISSNWHTGIYVGSRGGRFYYLHAPGKDKRVKVSSTAKEPYAFGNMSLLKMAKPQ